MSAVRDRQARRRRQKRERRRGYFWRLHPVLQVYLRDDGRWFLIELCRAA